MSEKVAKERHITLQKHLASMRECFYSIWDNYELILPKSCQIKGGIFHNEVSRVMGSRTPFERAQRITTDPLETECLYLLAKGENKALKLIPFLKVMPSPSTEQNACYFFSRREKSGLRFVSYHFETKAEVIEQFLDTAMTLDSIQRASY